MEVDKVTPGKAKKPGRVAWGKKLAALVKAHKEEKATSKRQVHEDEVEHVPKQKEGASSKTNMYVWLPVCSLVIVITVLCYQWRAALRAPSPVERCKVAHKPQQPPKKPASNIVGMQ
jgi:hypothetical protein